jgi:hypothetical protein
LEALLQQRKQHRPVSLLVVHWQVQNYVCYEVGKNLQKKTLGADASLMGCDASGHFLTTHIEGNLDFIGLFQVIFDRLIGQPISSQQVHLLYQLNCVFGL